MDQNTNEVVKAIGELQVEMSDYLASVLNQLKSIDKSLDEIKDDVSQIKRDNRSK